MNFTTYGLDIAKRVFQLSWMAHESGEIHNRRSGKQELLEFLAQREAGLIVCDITTVPLTLKWCRKTGQVVKLCYGHYKGSYS